MNEVFLIGKIISDIEFKFIINSKNKAIACFEIETNDKQIVRIQAYNQLADFVYSKLNKNNQVFINGYIENNVVKAKCIPYFSLNFAALPPVVSLFKLPVQNGWHFEQTSTLISFFVDPAFITLPHAHVIVVSA